MPEIPEGAKVPNDHQSAAEREAQPGDTATLTHGELSFTVPATVEDLDGEFLRFAADGDAYRMVEVILDGKQFARFKKTKPKVSDYSALGEQIAQLYGFESAGN